MERLGTKYGGWILPTNTTLNENSIIYSAGVGEDISFASNFLFSNILVITLNALLQVLKL